MSLRDSITDVVSIRLSAQEESAAAFKISPLRSWDRITAFVAILQWVSRLLIVAHLNVLNRLDRLIVGSSMVSKMAFC